MLLPNRTRSIPALYRSTDSVPVGIYSDFEMDSSSVDVSI